MGTQNHPQVEHFFLDLPYCYWQNYNFMENYSHGPIVPFDGIIFHKLDYNLKNHMIL